MYYDRPVIKALTFGIFSGALYLLLFIFEEQVLHFSSKGGWFFIIPVVIAFAFSFIHGGFVTLFWDLLGIRAKSTVRK